MEGHLLLSKQEKRQQFFYMMAYLLVAIVVMCFLFFRNDTSPFSNMNALELQMLQQKNKFANQQKIVQPLLNSTFTKINILTLQTPQPFTETDIKNCINQIANSFQNIDVFDTRKDGYLQIAGFYKMYFEDKKIAGKKAENITLFTQQFEECSIGFKNKEQELAAKKNAMLSRSQ